MPGASMKVELVGAEKVRRRLDELVRDGQGATPLMRDIGEHVLNATRDRFDSGNGQFEEVRHEQPRSPRDCEDGFQGPLQRHC